MMILYTLIYMQLGHQKSLNMLVDSMARIEILYEGGLRWHPASLKCLL